MSENEKIFNLWAIIAPAEDVQGEWLAHCVNLDVMSQGSSPLEAIEMIVDACGMQIVDDLNRGADPLSAAGSENWDTLARIQRNSISVAPETADRITGRFAINFNLRVAPPNIPVGTLPPGRRNLAADLNYDVPLYLLGDKETDGAFC